MTTEERFLTAVQELLNLVLPYADSVDEGTTHPMQTHEIRDRARKLRVSVRNRLTQAGARRVFAGQRD